MSAVSIPLLTGPGRNLPGFAQEISDKGAADGVFGTYCNTGSNQDTWYNIIYSYGGEVITEDKKASGYDELVQRSKQ